MEKADQFAELFERFIQNQCSPEEVTRLMLLLQDEVNREHAEMLIHTQVSKDQEPRKVNLDLKNSLEIRLQNILGNRPQTLPLSKPFFTPRRIWWTAAAVLLLIVTGWILWQEKHVLPAKELAKMDIHTDAKEIKKFTRSIILPDGSTVILKEGSTLNYPEIFTGSTRAVALTGEAYFDIAHDEQHPFIIQSGEIKTTVLGTAFNIKAYPGQKDIIVSVTRGKVKVENQSRVLALLTKDQQIIYNPQDKLYKQEKVDAEASVTEWTKQDVEFENSTFAEIADILEKRFGIPVSFTNPGMKQCTITASFDGTEPLEKILDVLCEVRPAKYRMQDNAVVIDGQGCK